MDSDEILLVDFDETHLDGAFALSVEARWPHRRKDWDMVLKLSNGIVAMDGARVVGTAFATPFGSTAATINMVIVAEAARGRGLGRRLMQAALAHCHGRECRLIATADGLPLYQKLGFRPTGEIRQYQGRSPGGMMPATVTWATTEDIPALVDLDRRACGMDRQDLINVLATRGRFSILRRDRTIVGFAGLRSFGRGEVVGPVVATSDEDARDLLSFLFAAAPHAFIRVDTPDAAGLGHWLAAQGLEHVGGGIAMCRDATPTDRPADKIRTYALASQALG